MEKELYDFEDVHFHYEDLNGGITFTIKDASYFFGFVENKSKTKTAIFGILHQEGTCSFCGKKKSVRNTICKHFTSKKEDVFEMLLRHPSVRLKWLFEKE